MRTLRRPMFRKGGFANEGIMSGLQDRSGYAGGGTIGGGMITGTPMGYRTGFQEPTLKQIQSGIEAQQGTQYTEDFIKEQWENFKDNLYTGGISQTDLDYGMQISPNFSTNQLAIMELIETQPEKSYEMFKSGKIGTKDYATLQEEQAKDLTGAGIEFDKFDFGTKAIIGKEPPLPEKKKKELEKIIAKNESLDDKTKRYMQMMAPHMQKRMVADALGAASAAFGESTGNTRQDIANAISAAATGMGGSKDIYDKVKMLTLQGEIMKDVESAKEKKLSNYEYLLKMFRSDIPEEKAWATQMMKKDDTSLSDLKGVTSGDWKNWALSENIDNKNFGGFLPENKQGEVIEDVKDKLDPDKFYFDQQNKMYVKLYIENGEKKIKKYRPPKK